jgi:dihydroxyacetone kinase
VAAAIRAGADKLASVGRASVGDKTLLDALVPFVDHLEARVRAGDDLATAWAAAAEVADERARATADLRPKIGRARPLADRSVGSPDPGAVSMALCAAAVARVLADGRDQ